MIKGNISYKGHIFRVVNNGKNAQVFIWQEGYAFHSISRGGVTVACIEMKPDDRDVYSVALDLAFEVYMEMVG